MKTWLRGDNSVNIHVGLWYEIWPEQASNMNKAAQRTAISPAIVFLEHFVYLST